MTRDELLDFMHSREEGLKLDALVAELNIELQHELLPQILAVAPQDAVSNWIYDKLCDLVAEADDILSPRRALPRLPPTQCNNCYLARWCKSYEEDGTCEFNVTALAAQLGTRTWDALVDFLITKMAEPKLSAPMRKFARCEPLAMGQTVIVDAVRVLGSRGNKITALKLIRGAFLDDNGHLCSLADAKAIYDTIMERSTCQWPLP